MNEAFQRRGALALLAAPLALNLATAGPAMAAVEKSSPVTLDTWLRVNTLIQTYADCIDRVDFDGLAQIFTPDAVYEYGIDLAAKGRSGIREFLSPILAKYTGTMTFMSTPNVSPGAEPGTYASWTSFTANHAWKNGHHHTVMGRYVDELQPDKETGALLIARRRVVSQMTEGDLTKRFTLERNG